MKYGICPISIAALRAEPQDSAEMISQVIFGEHFKVLDQKAKWSRIRLAHDRYEGWICNKQYEEITAEDYRRLDGQLPTFCYDALSRVDDFRHQAPVNLFQGCVLPDFSFGKFSLGEQTYPFTGNFVQGKQSKARLKPTALQYLNTPYLWGGRTLWGIDCSGFAQMVYRLNGINLPRDSKDQANLGEPLSFVEEAEAGDLAFFDNGNGDIVHVGIILDNYRIIHASGHVRIDSLDQTGIYNRQKGRYTHPLRVIKKII